MLKAKKGSIRQDALKAIHKVDKKKPLYVLIPVKEHRKLKTYLADKDITYAKWIVDRIGEIK